MTHTEQPNLILAIDQGTTSSRAVLFNRAFEPVAQAQAPLSQTFPRSGWVEQQPAQIWASVHTCIEQVLQACDPAQIAGIGITNQRETTLLWDRATGEALGPAIVWQDRRTADFCNQLKVRGCEATLRAKTGLPADPYFSASKLRWLLDHIPSARQRAERGELAFGTVDSWLIWQLTGGQQHLTDSTNAARTQLFNIHQHHWDDELLNVFGIPRSLLPEVRDCAGQFGTTSASLLGRAIPICGVAGDQQAALLGQGCTQPGDAKCTFGTGAFLMVNTGEAAINSEQGLLTTLAYRIDGRSCYALEGSVFIAGRAIQWLRDQLHLIDTAAETEVLAKQAGDSRGVMVVPAFTGLGAPHWQAEARAAILGMTLDTTPADIAVATLQSVAFQVGDLVQALGEDIHLRHLKVDGGMSANGWFVQFLADLLATPVFRPQWQESTVLGAARLAAHNLGWTDARVPPEQTAGLGFSPAARQASLIQLRARWQRAVQATLQFANEDSALS